MSCHLLIQDDVWRKCLSCAQSLVRTACMSRCYMADASMHVDMHHAVQNICLSPVEAYSPTRKVIQLSIDGIASRQGVMRHATKRWYSNGPHIAQQHHVLRLLQRISAFV